MIMILLRKLIYRRIVKGLEHRLESQQKVMKAMQDEMDELAQKMDDLSFETPLPVDTIKDLRSHFDSCQRVYGDAFARAEEVESAIMWVLKDFDRR